MSPLAVAAILVPLVGVGLTAYNSWRSRALAHRSDLTARFAGGKQDEVEVLVSNTGLDTAEAITVTLYDPTHCEIETRQQSPMRSGEDVTLPFRGTGDLYDKTYARCIVVLSYRGPRGDRWATVGAFVPNPQPVKKRLRGSWRDAWRPTRIDPSDCPP